MAGWRARRAGLRLLTLRELSAEKIRMFKEPALVLRAVVFFSFAVFSGPAIS